MNYTYSFVFTMRVRYSETDQMGYCYYGNYAQYLEVGRVEAIRNLGVVYKELEKKGILLPVSEFSIRYKSPAFYDDELTITTKIDRITGARIYFSYVITCEDKIIAHAETTLVFLDKSSGRPMQCPDFFHEKLKKYAK